MPLCSLPCGSNPGVFRMWQRLSLMALLALALGTVDGFCLPGHSLVCQQDGCRLILGSDGLKAYACAKPDFERFAETPAAAAAPAILPAAVNVFQLHSRPGATKVIYLDFDGHTTRNTPWSSTPIVTTAYDFDSNPSSFSDAEQANIMEIWKRVAESYSPFDVDVTTEAPSVADLIKSGAGDTKWGIRVLFGSSNPNPAPDSGGIAYVNAFGKSANGYDVPCFVLQQGQGSNIKLNSDAASHEVGHVMGLSHDGKGSTPYYQGQGSGKVAWAPQMGIGYYVPLVQWSKGEYASPTNTQDDLKIITTNNGFGYRPDDFTGTLSAAQDIPGTDTGGSFEVNVSGVIETRADVDWFKIKTGGGTIALNAVGGPANTMLDIQFNLHTVSGGLIASSNPTDDVVASLNQTVAAGTYYVKVEGVGNGNALTTGYTDYGSIGQYTITGSFPLGPPPGAPVLAKVGNLAYGVSQPAKNINTVITVSDSDSAKLASATVTIANVVSSEDELSLVTNSKTMGNIVANYDSRLGVLTLRSEGASATVAQFQYALRTVRYRNSSGNPNTTTRNVQFQVSDGNIQSNVLTSTVKIGYFYVAAAYDASTKTLTLKDDAGDNSVAISASSNQVTIRGTGATRIGKAASSQPSMTFPYDGVLNIVGNFNVGADSISVTGIQSTTVSFTLGGGNDTLTLSLCNITGGLSVDGGAGTDLVTLPGTTVASSSLSNIP